MSLTTTAPLSLPPHAQHAVDRHLPPHMSYPPVDDRSYQAYYGRSAPGSAHGAPGPHAPSPERLNSAGTGASVPQRGAPPPQSPSHAYPAHDMGPAPGSSHGYPPQPVPQMTAAPGYPPQQPGPPQPYYNMPQPQDPSPPGTGNGRPPTNFTQDGAPIVPVGISGGKMFRCRGFGECDKVFTRSEHLARHVRKHTGERPFPCHCGKAFSRLDNLRQHAATVHADQTSLNEAMLAQLASVHAALSQRANREQRRRGEVVEVPKNAVERPRGERSKATIQQQQVAAAAAAAGGVPPPGVVYPPGPGYQPPHGAWGGGMPPHDGRPRTGGSWDAYPPYGGQPPVAGDQHPPTTAGSATYAEDAGPSRRPPSSAGGYPHPDYYPHGGPPGSSHGRPPTADQGAPPGTATSTDSGAPPYAYRPVSSNGPPGHYADSEPPSSSHGPPPHSPMYPHPGAGGVPPGGNWTSPPTSHSGYPPADPSMYPQNPALAGQDGGHHPYPPGADGQYGPPPPGSSGGYQYPAQQGYPYYAGQQQSPAQQQSAQFGNAPPPPGSAQGQPGAYAGGAPNESPFQYNVPGINPYPAGNDGRKRRADEDAGGDRKHLRSSDGGAPHDQRPLTAGSQPGEGNPLWLPSTAERRSSLAISALLGSPQQETARSSRPHTADSGAGYPYPYPGAPSENHDVPPRADAPVDDKKQPMAAGE